MDAVTYRNRVLGCWLGKNIGGTVGMPMEWERRENNVTYYTHDITGDPLPNDDLDIQILWLIALEEQGLGLDAKALGEYFNQYMIFTHAEYGTAKTNLRSGLQPPVSGTFHNPFKNSCGCYIRSEIWASIYPGYPELAAEMAFQDAIVDHGNGEGVYAEVFIASIESAAFYEKDIRKLIAIGLSYIPEDSMIAKAVKDAVRTYDEGITPHEAREYIMQNYIGHLEWHAIADEDRAKGYGEGPMGFDVPSNLMIIIYGLLFGDGDFEKSMLTAVHFGEDTDCTAGTIAALYGIMYGQSLFTEKWTKPIGHGIVTISIDPFLMYGKLPKTVEELTDRVNALREKAFEEKGLMFLDETACDGQTKADPDCIITSTAESETGKVCRVSADQFFAPDYFGNLYRDMNVVRYNFPGLHVMLDYCGDPVVSSGETKQIRFILANTARSITSDRVNVYLYSREECEVLPSREQSVYLSMNHMGDGIRSISFDIRFEGPLKPVHRFVAEFIFEDSHNNHVCHVPFVLLTETGKTEPVLWENRGPACTPNLPRL